MTTAAERDLIRDVPPGLTERESRLLKEAGDRVSSLAQRLAASRRDVEAAQQEVRLLQQVLEETRRTRDILSAQVQSLLDQQSRDYEERSELRRLLAAVSAQFQTVFESRTAAAPAEPALPAPARKSTRRPSSPSTLDSVRSNLRTRWQRFAKI